jgi:hypothetical protein
MKKFPLAVVIFITFFTLTACNSSTSPRYSEDEITSEEVIQEEDDGSSSSPGNLFSRLNASGDDVWIEDIAYDMTGSQSLAVYLTSDVDGCAVWVFENEEIARGNLEDGTLSFPGAVFVGTDSESSLGVIFIAPEDNSPCTYNTSDVLGWGY